MKTPIAVTLIIMGALLIMTPVISDLLYQRNVVALLNRSGVTSVTLRNQMTSFYRLGCWLTGTGMIGVAVLGSGFARTRRAEHEALVSHAV